MTKTAEYINFEQGFLKEAELAGCDVDFLKGYIKQADEIVEIWKEAFDELAEKSGDPLYRYKLANEIIYFNMVRPELEKKAADLMGMAKAAPGQYQNFLGSVNDAGVGGAQGKIEEFLSSHAGNGQGMGGGIMKWLADTLHKNPNMLSSLLSGGAGGGLLGLLLGSSMGHPMMGMMMGGLGGAGASAYMGNQNIMNGVNNMVSPKPTAPGTTPPPSAPKPATSPTTTPPVTPPSPAMSTGVKPPMPKLPTS